MIDVLVVGAVRHAGERAAAELLYGWGQRIRHIVPPPGHVQP